MSQLSEEQRLSIAEKLAAIKKEREERDAKILNGIKAKLPQAQELLAEMNSHWGGEDRVYRFYHHSFKVYFLQDFVKKSVALFKEMVPDLELNEMFMQICNEALAKHFSHADNSEWVKATRVQPEAFFHCKYFLEMIVKYAQELETAPNSLPSGWASVLYLWNSR